MNKGRELLARAFESMKNRTLLTENERNLEKEISYYLLSTPEPTQDEKPIVYWDTQEGKLIPAVPLSSERTCFKVTLVPLYLHPPRPFIRMTREEIGKLADSVLSSDWTDEFELYHFARDIEDALVEKNK